jgi:hypothetical protein
VYVCCTVTLLCSVAESSQQLRDSDAAVRAAYVRDPWFSTLSESEAEYVETFSWMCAVHCSKTTGLRMPIYVSPEHASHGPQIKVSQRYDKVLMGRWFSVSIEDKPVIIGSTGDIRVPDLQQVHKFIQLNKQLLLDFWHSVDDDEPMDGCTRYD